tara:strand:+ start:1261 stop:2562 length:1302 start_codon:yes stop_codon:yes gene_type:complete
MIKVSSTTFYLRHHNEINKYISDKEKTLYITGSLPKKSLNLGESIDVLVIDLENNIGSQLESLSEYSLIIVTDIFELIDDIYIFLQKISKNLTEDGKLIISTINNIWSPILKIFEIMRLKNLSSDRSYMPIKKLHVIGRSAGFEKINFYTRQYIPFKLIGVGTIVNNFLETLFIRFNLGIRTYLVFKKETKSHRTYLSKSIIVPAKNEEGNLEPLIERIPHLGENCEIIIACGSSQDRTLEVANSISKQDFEITVIEQSENGKANAVWEALDICKGDVVAILDADISVEPEKLTDFFEIIELDRADFVNGTRLIYSMEKGAMRFLNVLGNRLFQRFISIIIRQPLTDSLCGTKVFKIDQKVDIKNWQNTINLKDPFGDYDLLFSAAYSGKQILELPIHYKKRTYGKTQISRFRDGYKLIRYLLRSFVVLNISR